MRIAMLANLYGPKSGGLKTTLVELSKRYVEVGHEILVVTPSAKFEENISGNLKNVTVPGPILPLSGGYRIILKVGSVIKIVKEFKPDVIEVSDRTTMLLVAIWAKYKNIPTIFFAHERLDQVVSTFLPHLPFKNSLVKIYNKVTSLIFTSIIATTNYAAKEFKASRKLLIVPLGVDLENFLPINEKPYNDDYLISATRLSKEKDPEFLLELARELKNRNINKSILVYGAGPLLDTLRELVFQEKLNIFFLGYLKDKKLLSERIAKASAYLAPGPIETFGLAALEALACGTPVICRDSSAITEIIDNNSGFSLPRNATKWVNAILVLESKSRKDLQMSCRNRAELFDWNYTVSSLLAVHRNNLKSSVITPETPILAK